MVLHKRDDEEQYGFAVSDVFEDIVPDVSDPFSQACSNIEYSNDT
jgi:hypothetical protein